MVNPIDQAFEFRNQMRRNKNRAVAGIAFLVRANHRLDKFTPDDGVKSGCLLIENKQVRLGAHRSNKGNLGLLAFGQRRSFLRRVEPKALEQFGFGLRVPLLTKRCQIIERLANTHPRVKCHLVGHIGQAPFHGDLIIAGIHTKYTDLAARGRED
jgi:hypothetical protein